MCALMAPVDPMAAEGKETVLDVLRRDRKKFFDLVEDPANWNVQTRCTEWEVRDLVGHMIDVNEGYLARWEVARKGETADDSERPRAGVPQPASRGGAGAPQA
jgi:hypothetical protein